MRTKFKNFLIYEPLVHDDKFENTAEFAEIICLEKPEIKYQEFFETEFKSVWYIRKKITLQKSVCTINLYF